MLSDFFRINLPYGIAKDSSGKWMAFNREYLPLGFNDLRFKENHPAYGYMLFPVYTDYENISEKLLEELACLNGGIQRDETGEIRKIFLYNDATNPMSQSSDKNELWIIYFEKLKKLAKLKVKNNSS